MPVPVCGYTLFVARADTPLVPLRPICDVLGLNWKSQHQKLISHPTYAPCVVMITTHDTTGRLQEMVAMVAEMVPLWLATIHPNKVAEKVRKTLVSFQMTSARLLYAAWISEKKGLPKHTGKRPNKELFRQVAHPADWLEHPDVEEAVFLRREEALLKEGFKAQKKPVRQKANALGRQVGLTAGQIDLLAWLAFCPPAPPVPKQASLSFDAGDAA
jgi:hypothetical protein